MARKLRLPGTVLVLLLLAAPAVADHAHVPGHHVSAPCPEAVEAAEAAGLPSPTPEHWTFDLTGHAEGIGEFDLHLVSESRWIVPNHTYDALGDAFSRFRGELVTAQESHEVTLVWERDPANLRHEGAQVVVHMVLQGRVHVGDEATRPLMVNVTFPGAPVACTGAVGAYNYMDVCVDGYEACAPAAWYFGVHARHHQNGPVAFTGAVDDASMTGTGHGRGVAVVEFMALGPF